MGNGDFAEVVEDTSLQFQPLISLTRDYLARLLFWLGLPSPYILFYLCLFCRMFHNSEIMLYSEFESYFRQSIVVSLEKLILVQVNEHLIDTAHAILILIFL